MDVSAVVHDDFKAWVPWRDAYILMRYLPPEEIKSIREKLSPPVMRDGRALRPGVVDTEETLCRIGRAAVLGWENIQVRNDAGELEEYPFTPENLDTLMTRSMEFSRFVNQACVDMQTLVDGRREDAEKNSADTSGRE